MTSTEEVGADIRTTCRKFRDICHKYPFTVDERVTLEHLWIEVEDKRLDAELEALEASEMRS